MIQMVRMPDWPERLDVYLATNRGRPFAWGNHDCLLFAAGWVRVATGADPVPGVAGAYNSPEAALRTLWQHCGTVDLVAAVTVALGEPLGSPHLAQRGDVAAVPTPDGPSLGVVIGATVACVARPVGLAFVPLDRVLKAWRIG